MEGRGRGYGGNRKYRHGEHARSFFIAQEQPFAAHTRSVGLHGALRLSHVGAELVDEMIILGLVIPIFLPLQGKKPDSRGGKSALDCGRMRGTRGAMP